jgi:glycosyltransferase involved in cell wall biosynthesis
VGEGPERHAYTSLVKDLDLEEVVKFHGRIEKRDLPLFYSAADLCVAPSRSEPLGRVVLESLACGTPVLGANTGGIPDLIQDNVTGLLFQRDSIPDLAKHLGSILEHRGVLQEMGREGREWIKHQLTWESVAVRIRDEIYRPILQERSGAC